jgi:AraC family transcriptional regulator, regulatory protein of adaptative response / methylated-DNA-[protein]-cysteine methyltransferase
MNTPAYDTVASTIRFLQGHATAQPSLAEIASHVGMSEFHLQRLFSQWAGVSPKRFLQYLTKESARKLLRDSANVLDTSMAVGLSAPSRLHDLMVQCEAVTPGEVGALGEGLIIRHGIAETPFGAAFIARTERGICRMEFLDSSSDIAMTRLRKEWPLARFEEDEHETHELATRIFSPDTERQPLHLAVKGTNFQIQVWQALLRIPCGTLTTYGDIAAAIGRPAAARAVGTAIGANPVAWLIPCHRVIRESGECGGYRWGIERKWALIAREASMSAPATT